MLDPIVAQAFGVMAILLLFLFTLGKGVRSRAALQLELLARRHQLHVLQRSPAQTMVGRRARESP